MAGTFSYTLNSLFAAQLDARTAEIADAIFTGQPVFAWLDSIKKSQEGSERFWLPVEYDTNPTVGMIGRGGAVNLDDTDPFTAAYYEKLTIAGNVTSFREDALINKGKGQIFDLIDGKIKNLIKSIKTNLETQLTATSLATGNMNPLSTLVESTPDASQTTTVGGISRTTNAWWRNHALTAASKPTATYITDDFTGAISKVESEGQGLPDTILLDIQTRDDYESYCLDQKFFVDVTLGDYTFRTLSHKGIPFIVSAHANMGSTSGVRRAYFLTSATIKFMYDPEAWFEWTDWKEIVNKPFDKVKQVVAVANLGISNPRLNYVYYAIGT